MGDQGLQLSQLLHTFTFYKDFLSSSVFSEFVLKASPSLQYQNLSFGEGKFIYVHKTEAHSVNVATKETSSFQVKDKSPVHQAKVVHLGWGTVLVIATPAGVQFWDIPREKALFVVHLDDEGSVFVTSQTSYTSVQRCSSSRRRENRKEYCPVVCQLRTKLHAGRKAKENKNGAGENKRKRKERNTRTLTLTRKTLLTHLHPPQQSPPCVLLASKLATFFGNLTCFQVA